MLKRRTSFFAVLFLAVTATPFASAQPANLDAFWQATRERLAREPMEAQVEDLKEPLPYKKFKVTLRSLDGVHVRGFLALPVQGEAPSKPWPVIVTTPGYGGTQQGVMLGECQRGYAILQIFPRGQGDSADLWKIDGPDKLTWRLEKPEGAYYQGAYADVIRAIDYVVSRPDIDAERVVLAGTSQGGGFSLAVGALDSRVKAVVAHVPFLCDFRLAAQVPHSIVKDVLDRIGRNDEAALRTLDYFDPLLLAPRLKVPVLVSAGGKDTYCPAATIQSVYARLPGEKSLKYYPDLPHTTCLDFYNLTWPWLDQVLHKKSP
ncbi:MAG: acetylxylan esterase [Verrucomicrobia bacterium]|nr:acetylxylan esterase [Verrucomicrobiota bacterium]